ncbi:MAG TPA: glycosyltransferase [Cytophagales bacterium]|nr:glycosyltransferase [Cytophagales bacterium]
MPFTIIIHLVYMARVTVIIVAHNVENTIRSCLNSILAQTEQDLEVLVFNNGSTDNTCAVLHRYEQQSPRITFIDNQQYQDSAIVKNNAIRIAKGEFLLFVEPEDQLEPDHIQYTLSWAHLTGNEMVLFGYTEYYTNPQSKETNSYMHTPYLKVGDGKEAIFRNVLTAHKGISLHPWQYLYKRDFLLKRNIFFEPSLAPYSYVAFSVKALYHTNGLAYNSQSIYHHWRTSNTYSVNAGQSIKGRLATVQFVKDFLQKTNGIHRYKIEFNIFLLRFGYIPAVCEYLYSTQTCQHKDLNRYIKTGIKTDLEDMDLSMIDLKNDVHRNKNTISAAQLRQMHRIITKRFQWLCLSYKLTYWMSRSRKPLGLDYISSLGI